MHVIRLNDYVGRPASELIATLHEATKSDESAVILDDGAVIGTLLSTDLGKDVLAKRLLESLEREPGQMDELLKRLDEEIVE